MPSKTGIDAVSAETVSFHLKTFGSVKEISRALLRYLFFLLGMESVSETLQWPLSASSCAQFNIVLNALDNVDARRHVNRLCLSVGIPLIESGTEGYVGQVRAIVKGKTKCFECDPPRVQKTFPICTIRNHPEKPVHCISWAKELLFKKLFGGEETDLVDTAEEGADGEADGGPPDGDGAAAAPPPPPPLKQQEGESGADFARRVFSAVFEDDVQRLLNMEVLWEKRRPPVKVELAKLALPDAAATAREEQRAWSVEESAAVLLASVERIFTQRASEVGSLAFDKDDDDAMDFVAAAANLRCATFHIPLQSRWEIKGIAGRIIHAIATTNAVIAGFIVLEAFKVLRSVQAAGGDLSKASIDACRYCVCNRHLSGPKENQLLLRMRLEAPEPKCYVCTGSTSTLELDTASFTVRSLVEQVVIKFLSFNKPTIDLTNELADKTVLLWEGEDEGGGEEGELHGDKPLDSLPVKLGPGVVLEVEDTTQALKCKIALTHTLLDKEEHPSGFRFIAAADEAAAAPPAPAEEDSPGGDGSRKRRKVAEGDAAVAGAEPSGGAGSGVVVADDDDDVIMLE